MSRANENSCLGTTYILQVRSYTSFIMRALYEFVYSCVLPFVSLFKLRSLRLPVTIEVSSYLILSYCSELSFICTIEANPSFCSIVGSMEMARPE